MFNSSIVLGDSFKMLANIPEEHFQLLLTDPPYNISKENNFQSMGRRGISFGDWDKDFDQFSWIKLADRALKPWASIVIWNDWKKIGSIANFLEQELKYEVKTNLVWKKSNPPPWNCKRRFLQSTEQAVWAIKPGTKNKGKSWIFNSTYHQGIFECGVSQNKHPTKKPTAIFQEIIEVLTNPNDFVLDPFSGSGTTAIACVNSNRNFLCIEKDPEYHRLSMEDYLKCSKISI